MGYSVKEKKSRFVEFYNNYWKYYRQLEDELLETRRYVDFSNGNLSTYSIEFLKLYQAVCSEIDVVGKYMALNVKEQFDCKNSNIQKWWYVIRDKYYITDGPESGMNNNKEEQTYHLYDYSCGKFCEIELHPWKNYLIVQYKNSRGDIRYKLSNESTTPEWWKNYNTVKHNRISIIKDYTEVNYRKANLENVVLDRKSVV